MADFNSIGTEQARAAAAEVQALLDAQPECQVFSVSRLNLGLLALGLDFAATMKDQCTTLLDRQAELEAENAALSASLTATKGHATRAKNEAAVLRAEMSPVARKVGRPMAAFGKPGAPYSPELAAIAIGGDEHVEIVFSDGKAEITALPPVTAYPQAWLQTGGRHMLREPIELEGGDGDIEVAGFALLSGGEQVGWRELPDPIRVPKNGRVRLENCITF